MKLLKNIIISISLLFTMNVIASELKTIPDGKYFIGTLSINSDNNHPFISKISGFEIGDMLVLPSHNKRKDLRIFITKKNVDSIRLRRGVYFAYRIPQNEIIEKKLKTPTRKEKYLAKTLEYDSSIEPEIYMSGDTYGDFVTFNILGVESCNVYAIDVNTNEIYYNRYIKTGIYFEAKFMFDNLFSLETRTFIFVFIDQSGIMTVSDEFTIKAPDTARISCANESPDGFGIILGQTFCLYSTLFNPNRENIECLVSWGDGIDDVFMSTSKTEVENIIFNHKYDAPGQYIIIISAREIDSEIAMFEAYSITVLDAPILIIENKRFENNIAFFDISNIGTADSKTIPIVFHYIYSSEQTYTYEAESIPFGTTESFSIDLSELGWEHINKSSTIIRIE